MSTKEYIKKLFFVKNVPIDAKRAHEFDAFAAEEESVNAVSKVLDIHRMLAENWKIKNRVMDILQQPVMIPNATKGRPYQAKLDFEKLGWNDLVLTQIEGIDHLGLTYDNEEEVISGSPTESGDYKIVLKFKVRGEKDDAVLNEKIIPLIINPDPKSLWQNKKSDETDPYWKPDEETRNGQLGEKFIVVSSKRGRSHANVGSFRDDDFSFKYLENGWSIVAVADGAGSAKSSRKGSQLACNAVIEFVESFLPAEKLEQLEIILNDYKNGFSEDTPKKLNLAVYDLMSNAAFFAYKKIADFSVEHKDNLKDYYTTLIFTLFKKYEFGYAFLSFGVGDCPIAFLNKDCSDIVLMNWLDVGEFGGGTRFINMPEVFSSDKFASRIKFTVVDDFSYLFLMTDGIYDPKFVVEANLEKLENWKDFLADLQGSNPDTIKVELDKNNPEIGKQLSTWMDFWSPGNHDDRTLAIIF